MDIEVTVLLYIDSEQQLTTCQPFLPWLVVEKRQDGSYWRPVEELVRAPYRKEAGSIRMWGAGMVAGGVIVITGFMHHDNQGVGTQYLTADSVWHHMKRI